MAGHIICFVSFQFVSFRFDLLRFVSICFVSFRFVSFRFVSFRFVFVSFRTLQGPGIKFFELNQIFSGVSIAVLSLNLSMVSKPKTMCLVVKNALK